MKRIIILIALTLIFCALYSDLFFSEYIEGNSNNKALEIFNPTETTVNLSSYFIKSNYNGNDWTSEVYEFPDGSTLEAGEVWVLAHESASSNILDQADDVLSFSEAGYVVSFNGNDARALFKQDGADEIMLDVIGVQSQDPGDGWDVAGVSAGTKDHTLVRKPSVLTGTTDWDAAAGSNASTSQWLVYDQDTFTYLGYHETEGEDTTPPILTNATAESETTVKLSFSEAVEEISAENLANYSITNLTIDAVELLPSNSSVLITTSAQTEEETYTITVNNVQDLAENIIEANSTINFTGFIPFQYDQIADIQNNLQDYMGQQVTVTGVVTIGDGLLQSGRTKFYIQDGSGRGIQVYNSSLLPTSYARGDSIEVTGTIDKYNDDVEITSPQVTLFSENASLPEPHAITGEEEVTLNGTWAEATGIVVDNWDSEYGFAQITIDIGDNVEIPLMFWDTTGADVSDYVIGDEVIANGIIAFYEGTVQLTCGYEDDIRIDATLPVIKEFVFTSDAMEEFGMEHPFYDEEIRISAEIVDYDGEIVADSLRLLRDEQIVYSESLTHVGDDIYEVVIPALTDLGLEAGMYTMKIWAQDDDGNEVEGLKELEITTRAPIITNINLENAPDPGDSLEVTVHIEDTDGTVTQTQLVYSLDYYDRIYYADLNVDPQDSTKFTGLVPPQKAGVAVHVGAYAIDDSGDETLKYDLATYTYPVDFHTAILKLPARPFKPHQGEKIPINFYSQKGDKIVLRIYNAEGKLMFTPRNEIIAAQDGINEYEWDGRDKYNKLLPIGLYICHLEVFERDSGSKKTAKAPIVIGTKLK
jgi:hypothetical protein